MGEMQIRPLTLNFGPPRPAALPGCCTIFRGEMDGEVIDLGPTHMSRAVTSRHRKAD